MKTKILIFISIIIVIVIGLIIYYFNGLSPVSNQKDEKIITIAQGSTMNNVADILSNAKLIKNKQVFLLYVKLNKISAQAGTYQFFTSENVETITNKIKNGDVFDISYSITFIEGKTLKNYGKIYAEKIGMSENEVIDIINDKDYLQSLIDQYWFLTDDILNDKLFFPLEGYLFPDTYQFRYDANVKTFIKSQLQNLEKKLSPYKEEIISKNLNVHDILTLASIIEKEANSKEDRLNVAGVFNNRLKANMSLGSDVTTYYAEQVEMGSVTDLFQSQYDALNDYNTRNTSFKGLPVGPICNPGLSAIIAAINPPATSYWYFWADTDGKVFFSETLSEHNEIIRCKGRC